jgi:glycosyltransferase involved in cell wall biosynthesis
VSDIPELGFVSESGFGLSFPSGSVDGLAEKIDFLLRDVATRADMGRKGRAYAGQFLWDGIALQFEDALRHIKR